MKHVKNFAINERVWDLIFDKYGINPNSPRSNLPQLTRLELSLVSEVLGIKQALVSKHYDKQKPPAIIIIKHLLKGRDSSMPLTDRERKHLAHAAGVSEASACTLASNLGLLAPKRTELTDVERQAIARDLARIKPSSVARKYKLPIKLVLSCL